MHVLQMDVNGTTIFCNSPRSPCNCLSESICKIIFSLFRIFLSVTAGKLASISVGVLYLIHVYSLILFFEGFINHLIPLRLEHLLEFACLCL
jgi:hypothetical protein